MQRKWLMAIIMIAIVIVGVLGWYFLFGMQHVTTVPVAKVYIDSKDYRTPIIWNLTTSQGATQEFSYNITNAESNVTSIGFNFTVWHKEGTQWVEQFNGTNWLLKNATVSPEIIIADNVTAVSGTAFANKPLSGESSTYTYSLTYNDQMIYLNLNYLGSNPTIANQTVFAYVAFDVNGNGTLNPSDKAFNFTSNPNMPKENQLSIYTPATGSSWKSLLNCSWNGNVSSSDVPIKVLCLDNRTNIMFAIPFSYIGATTDGYLGFVLQAFSHDWTPATANATTSAKYIKLPGGLFLPPTSAFSIDPYTTLRFYTIAAFTSVASGDYSIVFEFQATVQNS
jgi:hypothetical protein